MQKLFICLFTMLFSILITAQMTPFKKAERDAAISYFTAIGIEKKLAERIVDKKTTATDDRIINSQNFQKNLFLIKNSQKGKDLYEKLGLDLANAEKLKNNEEIQKDKEIAFKKSDKNYFINYVNDEYSKWLEKGQFEKTEEFNARLKNKTKAFDYFCLEYLKDFIKKNINPEAQDYNADNEQFIVKIELKKDFFIYGKLNVPINEAEALDWRRYTNDALESKDKYRISLKFLKIYNNNLIPTKIFFKRPSEEKSEYEFSINQSDNLEFNDIELSSNDIESANDLNHTFRLIDYLK